MKDERLKQRERRFRGREILEGIGLRSEKEIEKVLKDLKNKKKIRDFAQSSNRDDKKGKDFLIIHCGKREYYVIPIQVKSSRRGQEIHKVKHPEIPSIRVEHKHLAMLEYEIMRIITNFEKGRIIHI
jgi:hypothetical protein